MTPRFRCGLVVGKFCPLHRGHELLIRRALAECGRTLVLSYTKPEFSGCEPARRAHWLAELFPEAEALVLTDESLQRMQPPEPFRVIPPNDAPADLHRRFSAWVCARHWAELPDAVFTSEDYGDGFAQELTRLFQAQDSAHPGVRHICVDAARAAVPVSGTLLRQDVHAHRRWLSPAVYAGFVRRIVLLGGESTGKSSLAAALAAALGTCHVAEYGRELWEARGGRLTFSDLLEIAREQTRREQAAAGHAHGWLVCDTSPLTTLFYSREMFGRAEPALEQLATRPYDLTVLCADDFAFVQDGTRQPPGFRERQNAWYAAELMQRGIPFVTARGSVAERVAELSAAVRQHVPRRVAS